MHEALYKNQRSTTTVLQRLLTVNSSDDDGT